MLVEGFHGTTLASASALAAGSPWRPSTNAGDWLGFGSYFFQGGPERAFRWASSECAGTSNRPAVLSVEIDLSACLDFLDIDDFETAREIALTIPAANLPPQDDFVVERGRARPPRGTALKMRNRMDRYMVDWCVVELEPKRKITTVRSAFLWGHSIRTPSCIFNWSRVEIAVRDPAAIVSSPKIVRQ